MPQLFMSISVVRYHISYHCRFYHCQCSLKIVAALSDTNVHSKTHSVVVWHSILLFVQTHTPNLNTIVLC